MLAILVGVSLLSPWVGRPLTALFSLGYRRVFGTVGVLAAQNSLRNPRRTAATASALMIGLTLVALMSILGQSATASTDAAVKRTLTSQFVVSERRADPVLDQVARQVRAVPGVQSVAAVRTGIGKMRGQPGVRRRGGPPALGLALAVPMQAGTPARPRPRHRGDQRADAPSGAATGSARPSR